MLFHFHLSISTCHLEIRTILTLPSFVIETFQYHQINDFGLVNASSKKVV